MAKYDLRRAVASQLMSGTASPTITFSGSATAGDLIVLAYSITNSNLITPPSGFTEVGSYVVGGGANVRWYAKVATGSEGSSFTAVFETSRNTGGIGYMIEGPFANTSCITLSSRETTSGNTSIPVLASPLSLAGAGRAIAYVNVDYGGFQPANATAWSNGYADAAVGGGSSCWLWSSTLTYSSSSSSVQTTGTFDASIFTSQWMMRITEAEVLATTANVSFNRYRNGGVFAGTKSLSHYVFLEQSNGAPATGLSFNSSGLAAGYTRDKGSYTSITLATTTVTGTWTSGGFVEVSATNAPGLYKLDIPNAAFLAGSPGVTLSIKGTGLQPYHEFIPLEMPVDTLSGTATTGTLTASVFTTSGLQFANHQANRRLLQFLEGPAAGERVLIVGCAADGTLQVAPPLSAAPVNGNRFVVI